MRTLLQTLKLAFALMLAQATAAGGAEDETLRAELNRAQSERAAILEELKEIRSAQGATRTAPAWGERLTLGGYGEIHYNETKGPGGDYLDIHRFVLYMGYRFADWIQLHSELEIERSFVSQSPGGEGYVLFEQLYFDFLFTEIANLRVGRFLAPLGIINQTHEPTTYNGVERPSYSRVILLNTYSLDGVGTFGSIGEIARYELYLAAGLDGSQFSDTEGVRDGKMRGRPSTHEPALSGRVESTPMTDLRVGVSYLRAGVDNGEQGVDPGIDRGIRVDIVAADVRYGVGPVDLRVDAAETTVVGAKSLNAFLDEACRATSECGKSPVVGEKLRGYMAEVAVHVLPVALKSGRLAESDLTLFLRSDDYDTHARVPEGAARNSLSARRELTYGASFFPVPTVVAKIDRQVERAGDETIERFNAGLGWRF